MTAVATKERKRPVPDGHDWTLAWVPDLRRWEAEGVTTREQARRLKVCFQLVHRARRRHGLVKERSDRLAATAKAVLDAHNRGLPMVDIAAEVGISKSTVKGILWRHGLSPRPLPFGRVVEAINNARRRAEFRLGCTLNESRYARERLAAVYAGWPPGCNAAQSAHLGLLYDHGPLTSRGFGELADPGNPRAWHYVLLRTLVRRGWAATVGRAANPERPGCRHRVTVYDLTPEVREQRKLALHRQSGVD